MKRSLILPIAVVLSAAPAWGQTTTVSRLHMRDNPTNGEKFILTDTALMSALKDRLGGLYQNLQIVVGACKSEGFALEGERLLGGSFSVGTSTSFTKCEQFLASSREVEDGKTGLKIAEGRWAHGWTPQYFKAIKDDADATAAQLHARAKANDLIAGGGVFKSGGGGDGAKIHDGTQGSRAVVFYSESDDRNFDPKAIDTVLKGRGYDNATIDWAYSTLNAGDEADGVPIDYGANRRQLFDAGGVIETMRTYLKAQTGQRKALFVFRTHGSTEKRQTPKKENPTPGAPRQGRQVMPGDAGVSLELDVEFVESFFEEFTLDNPNWDRLDDSRPTIQLTTSQEDYTGLVDVLIDGLNVLQFDMLGLADGHTYEFEIADSAWSALWSQGLLADGLAQLQFIVPTGSFIVATEWDRDLNNLDRWGMGLGGPGIRGIPAPGAGALLVLAGVSAAARRRRRVIA